MTLAACSFSYKVNIVVFQQIQGGWERAALLASFRSFSIVDTTLSFFKDPKEWATVDGPLQIYHGFEDVDNYSQKFRGGVSNKSSSSKGSPGNAAEAPWEAKAALAFVQDMECRTPVQKRVQF